MNAYAVYDVGRGTAQPTRTWALHAWWVVVDGGGSAVGRYVRATRALVDALHNGTLADAKTIKDPVFGVEIAAECPNVPSDILVPWNSWPDRKAFDETSRKLATLFIENFEQYSDETDDAVKQAGPNV